MKLADADPDLAATRAAVLGDRIDITTLARVFGCSERTVYAMIERFRLPFTKIAGRRFVPVTDIRAAFDRAAASRETAPRKAGRPRKSAA